MARNNKRLTTLQVNMNNIITYMLSFRKNPPKKCNTYQVMRFFIGNERSYFSKVPKIGIKQICKNITA